MTVRFRRLRRLHEWIWRSQALRELHAQPRHPEAAQAVDDAKSCHLIAWRTLAGLEPVPARTRDAVARPLLLAGMARCLPLLQPARATLNELFEDAEWQQRFAGAGVEVAEQPALAQWLLEAPDAGKPGPRGRQALLVLSALLRALTETDAAIRKLRWRRLRAFTGTLALLVGAIVLTVRLVAPPEGADLAIGKPWQASSNYPGYTASGLKPTKPTEGAFFCTGEDQEPWWTVDLGAVTAVGSVTIENRADCCAERAPPLVVELSTDGQKWHEVARQNDSFRTWWPKFKSTKARYIRLRSLRRTFLHLKDVRVHAATGSGNP